MCGLYLLGQKWTCFSLYSNVTQLVCTVRINEVKREREREGGTPSVFKATCSSSTVCSGKRSVCACGRKQVRQTPGNFSAPQTAHSDAAQTAPIHDAFKRNEAVISAPTAAAVA